MPESLQFELLGKNYASAAVEMQTCGDNIHGLKQIVDRMQISTGQASLGWRLELQERVGSQELI